MAPQGPTQSQSNNGAASAAKPDLSDIPLIEDILGYDYPKNCKFMKHNVLAINILMSVTTLGPLAPPPTLRFSTKDDLKRFAQTWAKHNGYAVVTHHSNGDKNIYLRCDRNGTHFGSLVPSNGRETASRKCGCDFELRGSKPKPL